MTIKSLSSAIAMTSVILMSSGCTANKNVNAFKQDTLTPIYTAYEDGNKKNAIAQMIIERKYKNETISLVILNIDKYPFEAKFDLCTKHNSLLEIMVQPERMKPCKSRVYINERHGWYDAEIFDQMLSLYNETEDFAALSSYKESPKFFIRDYENTYDLGTNLQNMIERNVIFKKL